MKWDNGRSLSLIYGEDSFRILSPDEVNAERYEKKNHEFIRKLNKDIFPQVSLDKLKVFQDSNDTWYVKSLLKAMHETFCEVFDECLQSGTWKHIADAKGYVLINLFSLLHSEMKKAESSLDIQTEQKHLKIMAVGCLAFCCCREKQMGKTFSFDRYTDAVRSAYKPHRDTGNSEEQREVLQKKIASLEKEFGKSISLSFTEMKRQIDAVISLAVECLMLCATVECEQLEQLEQLEQGLALGLE